MSLRLFASSSFPIHPDLVALAALLALTPLARQALMLGHPTIDITLQHEPRELRAARHLLKSLDHLDRAIERYRRAHGVASAPLDARQLDLF